MNSRWMEILQILKTAKEPITSSQLSTDLQVSSKTVRNDIQALNALLQNHNTKINAFRGKGYTLETNGESSLQSLLQGAGDMKEIIPDEPGDRVNFLVERVLLDSGYVKIEDLADELYISRSTLQSDLKKVREILKEYDLTLNHKPNYGIKVNGSESKIRYCISEYIFNLKPAALEESHDWLAALPENDLSIIRNSILSQLREHNIVTSDVSLQNLTTHLAIACKRIRENNQVEIIHEALYEMKDTKEFAVAKEILQDIEAALDVSFPENEVAYLAIHLQGTKLVGPNHGKEKMKTVIDTEIQMLVKEIVNRIDEKYHFQLSNDEELLFNLSLHLKPAINRYKFQMNIRNPMLEEIKTKYPTSFEAALIGSELLYEKVGIYVDEHEIGYLALHIEAAQERMKRASSNGRNCLIVCASGLGSAQLLIYKLKDRFGDTLDIKGTTELYNLPYQSLSDIDFIVSTVPIEDDPGIPVVRVSTILGDSDVDQIERLITKDTSVIEQYVHERYTFLNRQFESSEEVIRFLGNVLMKDGIVEGDYIDSVLERESYSPTSFGNLVAIPHPLEPKTDSTFWSIVTLKKPIQWEDKLVQIVFLLNVNRYKKDDLKPMFHSLVQLVDDRNFVQQLLQCRTYIQFKNKLGNR
ncbi:BglG family transcription antiterminator [Virgibacillus siamensis]|uniref:BglG family transcription antiterminator n=1 Tax=Virgibacillus siamensis TaxID=480071 RepID=UPI00158BD469|nr:BglG family transcription antiterminator [Virgibacillus siamensis]